MSVLSSAMLLLCVTQRTLAGFLWDVKRNGAGSTRQHSFFPGHQRNGPEWTAGTALNLHRQRDHDGAARRELIEVRQVLQPRHVPRGRKAMDHEVGRPPVVDRGGVDAESRDAP